MSKREYTHEELERGSKKQTPKDSAKKIPRTAIVTARFDIRDLADIHQCFTMEGFKFLTKSSTLAFTIQYVAEEFRERFKITRLSTQESEDYFNNQTGFGQMRIANSKKGDARAILQKLAEDKEAEDIFNDPAIQKRAAELREGDV